jgi:hypothetical protein
LVQGPSSNGGFVGEEEEAATEALLVEIKAKLGDCRSSFFVVFAHSAPHCEAL